MHVDFPPPAWVDRHSWELGYQYHEGKGPSYYLLDPSLSLATARIHLYTFLTLALTKSEGMLWSDVTHT